MNNVIPPAQFDTSQLSGQINLGLKNVPIENPNTGTELSPTYGYDRVPSDFELPKAESPPVAGLDTSKTVIVPGDEKGSGLNINRRGSANGDSRTKQDT